MLSGIQHFAFCPRQWALVHIEQQWEENRLTTEGSFMHERADDPELMGLIRGKVILRSVNIVSYQLGLYGLSDIVELTSSDRPSNAITQKGYSGYWHPHPVEYKRGKKKADARDIVQVVAQAICLEEMYGITIQTGWIYYGETKHREEVIIDDELRALTKQYALDMHELYKHYVTPKAIPKPHCKNCSIIDICLPHQFDGSLSVNHYLNTVLSQ